MTLVALLAQAAERHGERTALVDARRRISFAELDVLAARAAGALAARGVSAGDCVAIVLPNSVELVAAFHGGLRLGAAVVPINPLSSQAEIEQRVGAVDARVIVKAGLDGTPVASADVRDDGVAVVLFTSGTTGDAKRVELTHAALRVNAEYFAHEAMRLRPDDVLFGSVPLSHVFGMTACMNGAVAAGASLALLRRFEPRAALELIERERVTIFLGVPSMCVALLAASAETGLAPQMRLAHVGGAPLPVETSRAFEERFGCEVYEGYGLTEVGGTATTNHVGRPRRHGSVGTPAAGGEVRLDERTGEVLLRTPTMMRGVDGWLATGDIGRLDEDGYLFLVGRLKDVILRGGYTVHPRELEEVLVEHPAVREAVVVGVPDERLGEDIVAVVVPAGDCDPDAVREWMRTRVAAYKYPRRVIVVDDLPRGPSGKVLRRAIDVPTTMPPI